jgi:glycosyltransferase involved in cell wall biosynthesis
MLVTHHGILFNSASDIARAHHHPDLDAVMHVFDSYWHGIRSATACLPGHKVAISHKSLPDGDALHYLMAYLESHKITRVCYQGFSECALTIANLVGREIGDNVQQFIVTHVSSAQFENPFEMQMLKIMLEGLETGLFRRLGSVKPRFSGVIPEFWERTLINLAPSIEYPYTLRDTSTVLIPVENHWRKNLYSNVLAAIQCDLVKKINVVNWPNAIENIADIDKLDLLPFMRPQQMLANTASCAAVMHSSLIECQPMTQLEALAVGTPCITARLGVHAEIDSHPLTQLCEVDFPDDVGALTQTLDTLCQLWRDDSANLHGMVADYLAMRTRLSMQSYLDFFN